MKMISLFLFCGLTVSGAAQAESAQEVLAVLQTTFKTGATDSYSIACRNTTFSEGDLSFQYRPDKNQLDISIWKKRDRGFSLSGVVLPVGGDGVIKTEISENSDTLLQIKSTYKSGNSSNVIRFDYDKARKVVQIVAEINGGHEECNLDR